MLSTSLTIWPRPRRGRSSSGRSEPPLKGAHCRLSSWEPSIRLLRPSGVRARFAFTSRATSTAAKSRGKNRRRCCCAISPPGKHDDWLKTMVLLVAPIYNADGNERFSLTSRGRQHGPIGGQGQRPNAQGLDLNRDHMKLDSPEARAFVKLMNDYDPHVSMDLHTTNGTRHAYYLTYSPPLNPATDPTIIESAAQHVVSAADAVRQDEVRLGLLLLRQRRRGGAAAAAARAGAPSITARGSTTTTSACGTGSRSSARPLPMRPSRTASPRRTASSRRASTSSRRTHHASAIPSRTRTGEKSSASDSACALRW